MHAQSRNERQRSAHVITIERHQEARPGHRLLVPLICLALFSTVWIALAIAPVDRPTWLLENLPTLAALPVALATFRRFRFSDRAYVQGTLFLVLHTIGSHYTYSLVPWGEWMQVLLDTPRNHYDRMVHFACGVLLFRPMMEVVFRRRAGARFVELWTTFVSIVWCGVAYEIVEWLTAMIVDPSSGIAFLGVQGDVWDAQKDLVAIMSGAAIAAVIERTSG